MGTRTRLTPRTSNACAGSSRDSIPTSTIATGLLRTCLAPLVWPAEPQRISTAIIIELDPHQDDSHGWGFELPEEKIIPVGRKFWHAVQAMAFRMDHLKDSLMKLNIERSSRGSRHFGG